MTGRAIIQSAADGENSIGTSLAARSVPDGTTVLHKGANFAPRGAASPDLSRYSHLLVQNEVPLDDTVAHVRAAGANGVVSVFNPSPMLLPEQLRAFPWDCLSWLIVNEGELLDLLQAMGIAGASAADGADAGDLKETAKRDMLALRNADGFSPSVGIICTLGAQGILCLSPGSENALYLPAGKIQDKVRDTTGAGDCFAGYFVAGLMRDESVEDALKTCLTVSAMAITRTTADIQACAMCVEQPGAMDSYATLAAVRERMTS